MKRYFMLCSALKRARRMKGYFMLCSARGGSWGMSRSKKQVALDALEAWIE